jgi:hypothetical protein
MAVLTRVIYQGQNEAPVRSDMRLLRFGLFAVLLTVPAALPDDDPVSEPTQRTDAPFRLFRTKNIYTFLKLDTRTGRVWQLQWGTDDSRRAVEPINLNALADGKKAGRFTLYPSSNIFNFVLLDQEDGRQWQVQWSIEAEKRFIVPIGQWQESNDPPKVK